MAGPHKFAVGAASLVLLLVVCSAHAAEMHQRSDRLRDLLQHTSSSKATGSEKPSFKSESKETPAKQESSFKVTHNSQPTVDIKKEEPKKTVESKSSTTHKGTEGAKMEHTKGKDGSVFVYDSGKRAFEYNHKSQTVVNFPKTTIVASGGEPLVVEHKTSYTPPIKESKTVYKSGNGPTYEHKWSYTAGPATHGRRLLQSLQH